MPSIHDRARPQMPTCFVTDAMGAGLARLLWVAGRAEEAALVLASVEAATETEGPTREPRRRLSRKASARLLPFAVKSA